MLFSATMAVASEAPASFRSSAIRPRPWTLVRQGFAEILSRRRLIGYLVQADLKKKGSDTLLGNVWWIVDPLLQMLVYVVLVTVIFDKKQPDYPLFVFCAILPWKWFTSSINDGIASVVGMERLIKQINFPKLVLPVSGVFAGIANFAFGMIPLFGLILLFYPDRIFHAGQVLAGPGVLPQDVNPGHLNHWILAIPLIAAVQLLFTLPLAIILGAINVFYRDVGNLARHVLRLYFYVSPGIYAVGLILPTARKHPPLDTIFLSNPWAILFTSYRNVIYEGTQPDWIGLGLVAFFSLILLALAILVFKRLEPTFAKVL